MVDITDFRSIEEYRQWVYMACLLGDYPMDVIRARGLARIPRLRVKVRGDYNQRLLDDWQSALEGDDAVLRTVALDRSQHGIDMRQNNPFAGIMSPEDNWRIVRETRDEQRRVLSSAARVG